MAIARGAGTEIIRTVNLEDISSAAEELIFGYRHHIYTVLSVLVHAVALNAAGDYIQMYMTGYDSLGGTPQATINIFRQDMNLNETFVWNDKFSFMGYEPVDFTAGMDSEAKQDAVADQLVSGDSNRQILGIYGENANDQFDVICTYIDQNNA